MPSANGRTFFPQFFRARKKKCVHWMNILLFVLNFHEQKKFFVTFQEIIVQIAKPLFNFFVWLKVF